MRAAAGLDIIAGMRSRHVRLALASAVLLAACQTPSPEGAKKDSPVAAVPPSDAKSPDAKTPDVKAPDAKTLDAATAGAATAGAATAAATAGDTAAAATAADTTPAADTAAAADTAPAGDTAGTPAATADKGKLLDEAKAKKTSDARVKKALEEAEAAGATPRELAEASNARGVALMGDQPEKATAAFEWARDKDPTYPDASFNLAKQSALAGETPEAVKHLQEVNKRGGKKLLKQVGYDPVFEAVKDDPEIQKIAK